jgi:hypothetical protein
VIAAAAIMLSMAISSLPERRARGQDGGGDQDISRSQQGYAIAPLPLTPNGQDPSPVGLGSYFVNAVAECIDCHTNPPRYLPGGNPFLGQPKQLNTDTYLRGGFTFPAPDPTGVENPITSRNLRPENGLPAGLTLAQFMDVLRNGTDYDHPGRLLQVMPWPIFQNMTDGDIQAIYAYLSTLPP